MTRLKTYYRTTEVIFVKKEGEKEKIWRGKRLDEVCLDGNKWKWKRLLGWENGKIRGGEANGLFAVFMGLRGRGDCNRGEGGSLLIRTAI